jgi:hypothetical protein
LQRSGHRLRPRTPFPATSRWLRGRIVDRLRLADGNDWVDVPTTIGTHNRDAVGAALRALASEGLIELAVARSETDTFRARLAVA